MSEQRLVLRALTRLCALLRGVLQLFCILDLRGRSRQRQMGHLRVLLRLTTDPMTDRRLGIRISGRFLATHNLDGLQCARMLLYLLLQVQR